MKFALLLILLTGGFLLQPLNVIAWEISSVSADTITEGEEGSDGDQTNQNLTPEQQERRKQIISVSWILLVGVAILGGILLLIVFLFGSRLRRMTRKPLPDAPLRDPMWYLKNKVDDSSESSDEPADTDHE